MFQYAANKYAKQFRHFLLRDAQSWDVAKKYDIPFRETLDVVFSEPENIFGEDETEKDCSPEVSSVEWYSVFVPNEVNRWHPAFLHND